jgi:hypothetical protein
MAMNDGSMVALKSCAHDGEFLSAWDDNTVRLQPHCKAWEIFRLEHGPEGTRYLRSVHGGYLSAWNDNTMRLQPHAKKWERFEFSSSGDSGSVFIKTHHGTFVSACDDHITVNQQPHSRGWEKFDMFLVLPQQDAEQPHSPYGWAATESDSEDEHGGIGGNGGCSCVLGTSRVLCADSEGSTKKTKAAADVRVGDQLCTIMDNTSSNNSATVVVTAIISTLHEHDPHPVCNVNGLFITMRHPIFHGGSWVQPQELIKSGDARSVLVCGTLINFVTEPRAPLLIDGVVVSTLGMHCPGVDDGNNAQDTTSFYGSEQVVDTLASNPQWPHIKKVVLKDGTEKPFGEDESESCTAHEA